MCLPSNITSWPPLGQLTFIHRKRGAQDNIHATNVRRTAFASALERSYSRRDNISSRFSLGG